MTLSSMAVPKAFFPTEGSLWAGDEPIYPPRPDIVYQSMGFGTVEEMDLERMQAMFAPGQLIRLDLFLRDDLTEDDRPTVERAVADTQKALLDAGAEPWEPDRPLLQLNWSRRSVQLFAVSNFVPVLLLIAAIALGTATVLVGAGMIVTSPEFTWALGELGITLPLAEEIRTALDAVAVAGLSILAITYLRQLALRLGTLPFMPAWVTKPVAWVLSKMSWVIGLSVFGGALIAMLRGEGNLAWRLWQGVKWVAGVGGGTKEVFKQAGAWVTKNADGSIDEIIKLLKAAGKAALIVGGVVLAGVAGLAIYSVVRRFT